MDRQVSQLLLQVDANIAVAQREMQNLARVVKQSSGDMNTSLDTTVRAHARLGSAMGNTRIAQMELQHVITASSDAYAAGASPIRILSLEMGRLAEAAAFLGGSGGGGVMGKLANFMSGPWGIAVLIGVQVLAQLIQKHFEAGDSVDALVEKMRRQAQQALAQEQAQKAWAQSLEGVEQAIHDVNKALDELEHKTETTADKELDAAQKALAMAQAHKVAAQAALDRARAELALTQSLASRPGEKGDLGALRVPQAYGGVDAAQSDISRTDAAIAAARAAIERAQSFVTVQNAEASATDKIRTKYEALIEAARKRALAENSVGKALDAQVASLVKARDAEIKAAESRSKGSGEFGKQIGFGDAEAIAHAAGLTVTSGYRSEAKQAELYRTVRTAENPVARPGTSAHEGVNGKWALDIAFAPGLTADKLKKLYGDQGVSLSAVYKESGHFHIEGSRSQAAAQENAAARAARAAAAAAQKAKVDDDTFARESAQLDAEILAAKKQIVGGFDTQAQLADDEIDAQRKAQLAAVQKQLDAHQIEAAEAKILSAKVNELADTRKAAVDEQKYRQALEQTLRAVEQTLQFRSEDLKFADDMATTQSEHRKLQLAILDIQYQQRKAELEYQLMLVKRNQDFATSAALQAQAASIQGQLDRLPTEQSQDQARVRQGTLNPLEAWAKQVPHTAAQINEALQSIEVQGLDSLASSITDVITGTKSLGAAFHDIAGQIIADIIQMTVKMLIFRAISAVAGALGGGGISDPFAGGGGLGGASFSGGFDPGALSAPLPHLAGGGMFSVGGNAGVDQNMLSINGVPRAMVGANENIAVIPQASRINVGGANGGSAPIELIIQTVPSDDAWGKVQVISAQHANQAVKVSVNHTNDTVRSLTRPRLMGGRG